MAGSREHAGYSKGGVPLVYGKPCPNGHEGRRLSSTNRCYDCTLQRQRYYDGIGDLPKRQPRDCRVCGGRLNVSDKGNPVEFCSVKCRNKSSYWTKREHHINRHREWAYRVKYGITTDDFDRMLKDQGYKCKVCGSKRAARSRFNFFHVDHCHDTGKVRGLLCGRCNISMGAFNDDPNLLEVAASYLRGDLGWPTL